MGISRRRVASLVSSGALVRVRNGRYLPADTASPLRESARYGGRLDCVSLLALLGVFVRENPRPHVQFTSGTTRLPPRPSHVVAHWRPVEADRNALAVDVVSALIQSCRCQQPRDAIATLDSAWNGGLISEAEIAQIFDRLPRRFQSLRGLLDRRSESGAETLMRLMLVGLGCSVDLQVGLPGVGRVDLIVDGWLIVECDSRAFHEGWAAQMRDRRRDIAAAALGYTTIRPLAEDIYFRREEVLAMIKRIMERRAVQNSTNSSRGGGKN